MPDENPLTLRQDDQARSDSAAIESDPQFVMMKVALLPMCTEAGVHRVAYRAHDGSARPCRDGGVVLLGGDRGAWQLDAVHYRRLAKKLRSVARECRLPNPQHELLTLARRYERRADHLDRRA